MKEPDNQSEADKAFIEKIKTLAIHVAGDSKCQKCGDPLSAHKLSGIAVVIHDRPSSAPKDSEQQSFSA